MQTDVQIVAALRAPELKNHDSLCIFVVCFDTKTLMNTLIEPAVFLLYPQKRRKAALRSDHSVSACAALRISLSLRPPGQHMEPSKLVFNFPAAVVRSAALTAALRELIRTPRA